MLSRGWIYKAAGKHSEAYHKVCHKTLQLQHLKRAFAKINHKVTTSTSAHGFHTGLGLAQSYHVGSHALTELQLRNQTKLS